MATESCWACRFPTAESTAFWTGFYRDLIARGLTGVFPVTSDAHLGIQAAVGDCLPQASWQRCRTHFAKNLSSQVPKTQWSTLSAMFHTISQQPDANSIWAQARKVVSSVGEISSCGQLPRGITR